MFLDNLNSCILLKALHHHISTNTNISTKSELLKRLEEIITKEEDKILALFFSILIRTSNKHLLNLMKLRTM